MAQLHPYGFTDSRLERILTAHFFEPALLKKRVAFADALKWSHRFVDKLKSETLESAVDDYQRDFHVLSRFYSQRPDVSFENPPFSLASPDGFIGSLPWRNPSHATVVGNLLLNGPPKSWPWGNDLLIAFIENGGPANNKDSCYWMHAPSQSVRASAEHWFFRSLPFAVRTEMHLSTEDEITGKTYSVHRLTTSTSNNTHIYFDTTTSRGREMKDLDYFLDRYPVLRD